MIIMTLNEKYFFGGKCTIITSRAHRLALVVELRECILARRLTSLRLYQVSLNEIAPIGLLGRVGYLRAADERGSIVAILMNANFGLFPIQHVHIFIVVLE